jgi:hypothetical protein
MLEGGEFFINLHSIKRHIRKESLEPVLSAVTPNDC